MRATGKMVHRMRTKDTSFCGIKINVWSILSGERKATINDKDVDCPVCLRNMKKNMLNIIL